METDQLLISLMQVFIAQMDSALKISTIISEHSNEKEMSPDSLVIGLVYRLMISMEDEEMNESMEKAKNILNKESSSEDELSEDELNEREPIHEEGEIQPRMIKTNNCNCNICAKARACILNYRNYEVNDKLAQKFKDAIDNTCKVHRLIIN
tara:strand:- start:1735 stop:2190 length:456 start_codon:yes stop_codon:yes gene_type:complete